MIQIKTWSHMLIALMLGVLALSLIACNPDDNDSGGEETHNEKLNGIWVGEYGAEKHGILFLMHAGEIYGFTINEDIFAGTYTYTMPNGAFVSTLQSSTGGIQIEGTASEGDRIDGTYTRSDGGTVDVAMQFDEDSYTKASSFELLAGQWAAGQSSYVIDKDGGLTGTFLGSCMISGVFSIIDANYNLYVFDADLTDCGPEGQYHGLAYLVDKHNVENSKIFGIASDSKNEQGMTIGADRQ